MNPEIPSPDHPTCEWLEPDGRGGFASGTADGRRTRRYHALLLTAQPPPTGRFVLVNGLEVWLETAGGRFALSTQAYAPGVVHPDGAGRIRAFTRDPWPAWTFACEDGTRVRQEVFVAREHGLTVISWRRMDGAGDARLRVRPLISGRDYHALHRENGEFRFASERQGDRVTWRPYPGVPAIHAWHGANGAYADAPDWYRNFLYSEERARGLDHTEDLASPGVFTWDLAAGEAVLVLGAEGAGLAEALRTRERERRAAFPSPLHRAADDYVVEIGRAHV